MKERFQIILDKAADSLEAARLLEEQGYYDFSASRAYYVMFYAAEALLLARGLSFSSHAATIANYGKEYSKTGDVSKVPQIPHCCSRPAQSGGLQLRARCFSKPR